VEVEVRPGEGERGERGFRGGGLDHGASSVGVAPGRVKDAGPC